MLASWHTSVSKPAPAHERREDLPACARAKANQLPALTVVEADECLPALHDAKGGAGHGAVVGQEQRGLPRGAAEGVQTLGENVDCICILEKDEKGRRRRACAG